MPHLLSLCRNGNTLLCCYAILALVTFSCKAAHSYQSSSFPKTKNSPEIPAKIDDPQSLFLHLDKDVRSRIGDLEILLNDSNSSKYDALGKFKLQLDTLRDIQRGLEQMKRSDTKYHLFYFADADTIHAGTTIDSITGTIQMTFPLNSIGQELVGHEIIHGIEYERGELSLYRRPKLDNAYTSRNAMGTLYDLEDETKAFRWARLIKDYTTVGDGWNNDSTILKDPNAYMNLTRKQIDLHSKKGHQLRRDTYREGSKDLLNSEFYTGWQKDYKKGCRKYLDSTGRRVFPENSPCAILLGKAGL